MSKLSEQAKAIIARRKIRNGIDVGGGFNLFSKECYEAAAAKGFHNEGINDLPTMLLHIIVELSEAVEADRNDKFVKQEDIEKYKKIEDEEYRNSFFYNKIKDTFEDEIADCFIRLGDLCGKIGIDIDFHIKAKMDYNKCRAYLHGKKY